LFSLPSSGQQRRRRSGKALLLRVAEARFSRPRRELEEEKGGQLARFRHRERRGRRRQTGSFLAAKSVGRRKSPGRWRESQAKTKMVEGGALLRLELQKARQQQQHELALMKKRQRQFRKPAHAADDEPIILEGPLAMRSRFLLRTWQKWHFRLRGNWLSCYSKPGDAYPRTFFPSSSRLVVV